MPSPNLKLIYILRAQCEEHKLDRMIQFYRVPNSKPQVIFKAHEKHMKKTWPETHGCEHKIKFTRIIDEEYLWDVKNNKPVKREGFKNA